jgi:hypothetical protein
MQETTRRKVLFNLARLGGLTALSLRMDPTPSQAEASTQGWKAGGAAILAGRERGRWRYLTTRANSATASAVARRVQQPGAGYA